MVRIQIHYFAILIGKPSYTKIIRYIFNGILIVCPYSIRMTNLFYISLFLFLLKFFKW